MAPASESRSLPIWSGEVLKESDGFCLIRREGKLEWVWEGYLQPFDQFLWGIWKVGEKLKF